ncbi:MAG TPA: hypothetical protein VGQ46_20790 [Thermoanaerobaculia bacterium]|jgi:hypothetical protein|nr:hypothetical protein [Thermoanaerobaculia bacterium]
MRASVPESMPKSAVVLILCAWLGLLTLTHFGARSPYSYGWAIVGSSEPASRISGAVVNPDALPLADVAMFFYDAAPVKDWEAAQNLRFPSHAFATSILAGLTRSYLFSSVGVNFLFAALVAWAAVNVAERFAMRRSATLVALLTALTLPIFVEYLGQPMHYLAGIGVSFLVVLSILALTEDDARRPWIAGIATAILVLNYDPFVFLAALIAYVLVIGRFARRRDYAIFLATALVPAIVWVGYLRWISHAMMSHAIERRYFAPVAAAWSDVVRHPLHNVLMPFVASHIGIHIAFREIVALIHWPLLVVCVALLIHLRPRLTNRRMWIIALLPVSFVLEQMGVAAWDWELNPRRAIPVALAFGVSYCYAANAMWPRRGWRIAFIALLLGGAFLAMSDTITRAPLLAYLHTGQGMPEAPQHALAYREERLDDRKTMPSLAEDQPIVWRDLQRATVPEGQGVSFAFVQLFNVAILVALFSLTARARILPHWTAAVAVAVWLISFVRFL